jgi:hypothetical protein
MLPFQWRVRIVLPSGDGLKPLLGLRCLQQKQWATNAVLLCPDPIGLEIKAPCDVRLSIELSAEHIGVLLAGEQE